MAAHQKGGSSRQGRGGKSEIDAGKALGEARTSGAGNTISATGDGMPQDVVTLVSMDGDSFVVEALAIMASQLIKVMVDGERDFFILGASKSSKYRSAGRLQLSDGKRKVGWLPLH